MPLAAQEARRGPVQYLLASLELLSAPEPPAGGPRAHVPLVHVVQVYQRLVPRVSPELRSLHAARAALTRLLPPLLSRRAPQRLPLRRRQHPSNDGGLVPQLRP